MYLAYKLYMNAIYKYMANANIFIDIKGIKLYESALLKPLLKYTKISSNIFFIK